MSETSKNQRNIKSHSCKKWCEDCQSSYSDGCPDHKSIHVPDRPVLPRAFSTLPSCLVISKVHEGSTTSAAGSTECKKKRRRMKKRRNDGRKVKENGGVVFTKNDDDDDDDVSEISRFDECFNNTSESPTLGVFARKKISQRTQFGPVVSKIVEDAQNVGSRSFHLTLYRNKTKCRLALSDVESSNWMMFVRPATSSTNQNLAAFQYDQSIFYISTKVIEEGQELRVWYARPYAEEMNLSMLDGTTTEELGSAKVNGHDGSCLCNYSETLTAATKESSTKFDPLKKEVRSNKRRRRLVEKKNDDDDDVKFGEEEENIGSDDDDDDDYHHKKDKKTCNGLRRRKKQTRRRTIASAPSKVKDNSSTRDWCCQQCGISFDDPSLLRLHNFVHAGSDPVPETAQTSSTLGSSKEPDQLQPPYSCPACNQEFETGSSLTCHVDRHGSVGKSKPFKCQICLKAFANFERLQQHLLCHGDESLKPLACEVCSRRFMNPAALSVHMKTHGDRKYYTCPLCPESFDQVQQLRSHAEERHLERSIKVFEQTECDAGKDEDADMHDDAADGSCAGVAIATATTAINSSGVWIGSVDDDDDSCRKGGEMATDTELEFMSDVVGHCLFAEEVTTDVASCHGLSGDVGEKSTDGCKGATKIPSGKAEGTYHCPECHRVFTEFSAVSRHVRLFHSSKSFECKECGRVFPRMDKLRLHSLRHSSHREFVCETCGRQFKRKDKLRDHVRRQHDVGKKMAKRNAVSSFTPEISPLDLMKFVFKCQKCLVGFKRRGMLVNHMAKKHPDVPMNSVPELNLPIVTSKHDFFCQYCHKVFKSNSKRKFHILKHHPGSEVPASLRPKKRSIDQSIASKENEVASIPRSDSTFSTPSGHLAVEPYSCSMCHRQYSSKSKLCQHRKKKHPTSDVTFSMPSCNGSSRAELESVSGTLQVVDIPIASTLSEVDYGDLFMGASIYFAPKGSCMEGESDMAATGSVLVLSNEEDPLMHGASHLSFAKTQTFAATQAQINYPKPQQALIIDTDVFAQAMNELTKSYAGKNSVLLTHFEAQHQFPHDGSHHDVISLNLDNGTRFGSHQQEGAQCAIMSSPYISVVEYESLCSASSHTP